MLRLAAKRSEGRDISIAWVVVPNCPSQLMPDAGKGKFRPRLRARGFLAETLEILDEPAEPCVDSRVMAAIGARDP